MSEQSNVCSQNTASDSNIVTNNSNPDSKMCQASNTSSVSLKVLGFHRSNTEVLLSTAIVYIRDNLGKFHKVRALLDNGSQSNFITKSACEQLTQDRSC